MKNRLRGPIKNSVQFRMGCHEGPDYFINPCVMGHEIANSERYKKMLTNSPALKGRNISAQGEAL